MDSYFNKTFYEVFQIKIKHDVMIPFMIKKIQKYDTHKWHSSGNFSIVLDAIVLGTTFRTSLTNYISSDIRLNSAAWKGILSRKSTEKNRQCFTV